MNSPAIAALLLLLTQNAGPPTPASISGIVSKSETGESLAKVTVTLTPAASTSATTPGLIRIPGDVSPSIVTDVFSFPPGVAAPSPATSPQLQPPPPLLPPTPPPVNPATSLPSPKQLTVTSSDGTFRFENLKPGSYTLTATLGGYAPAEYGQRGPNGHGMPITLKSGQKVENASLDMTPGGTITGRIIDSNGDPVSRGLVQALKLTYQENGKSLVAIQAVPTNDRGEYRMFWLPAGRYYIRALPPDDRAGALPIIVPSPNGSISGTVVSPINSVTIRDLNGPQVSGTIPGVKINVRTLPSGETVEEATVPVYYPSTPNLSLAPRIEIHPGEIISGVDITVSMAPVYRIRGVTQDAGGRMVPVGTVALAVRNGPVTPQSVTILQPSASALFEIAGVVSGSYYLSTAGGAAPVDVAGADVNNVVIAAVPSATISGRILIDGNTPSTVQNISSLTRVSFRLIPDTPGMVNGGLLTRTSSPDGTFSLDVMAGDYRVAVVGPSGFVPKSILFNGKDVLSEGLHAGSGGGTLSITLTANSGRVEGNVVAGRQRASNATVVLVPGIAFRRQTNLYQSVQTNADGHFTIDNISPGTYKLFAWDDAEDRSWFDPEYLRDFEARGTEIVIREGAKENLDIPLIPR